MTMTLTIVGVLGVLGVLGVAATPTLRRVRRALQPAFGAWTMSYGCARRPLRALSPRLSLGGTHYLPRFPGRDPISQALAQTAVPISVVEAAAVCRRNRLRCDLEDLDGRIVAHIDADGRIG